MTGPVLRGPVYPYIQTRCSPLVLLGLDRPFKFQVEGLLPGRPPSRVPRAWSFPRGQDDFVRRLSRRPTGLAIALVWAALRCRPRLCLALISGLCLPSRAAVMPRCVRPRLCQWTASRFRARSLALSQSLVDHWMTKSCIAPARNRTKRLNPAHSCKYQTIRLYNYYSFNDK